MRKALAGLWCGKFVEGGRLGGLSTLYIQYGGFGPKMESYEIEWNHRFTDFLLLTKIWPEKRRGASKSMTGSGLAG